MDRHVRANDSNKSSNSEKKEFKWILQTNAIGLPAIFLGMINVTVKDQTLLHNLLMIVQKPTNLFPITKSSVPTVETQSTVTHMT